jgi:hypothetical protein
MKVFEINPDFAYQTFYTSDPDGPETMDEEYSLDGGSKLTTWRSLPIFEADPAQKPVGNFAHCWDGGFIVDTHASTVLKPVLEKCAELLPLKRYKGRAYYLLNVLNCPDCLDERRTKWRIGKKNKVRFAIDEYQFVPDKLTDSTLFRIPKHVSLFTVVGRPRANIEFKTMVEREGLTGLKFEEIWSEGGPPIKVKGIVEQALG